MQKTQSALILVALVAATSAPSFATDTPATDAMMPKCALSDQVVMVDTVSKTYELYQPSSTSSSRKEKARTETKTNIASTTSGKKPMCKSKADAMGAKMMPGAPPAPAATRTP